LGAVIGIAGGIAFLLMIFAGFQIITSTGDPEKLNRGKEILTSAIIGLVVIVFSVFLLKLIGVDILQLPGFEK
jgi:Co/Zn/Cd efflux system component